jgi:hypothetical protein
MRLKERNCNYCKSIIEGVKTPRARTREREHYYLGIPYIAEPV